MAMRRLQALQESDEHLSVHFATSKGMRRIREGARLWF
jgi:hypothetical protein